MSPNEVFFRGVMRGMLLSGRVFDACGGVSPEYRRSIETWLWEDGVLDIFKLDNLGKVSIIPPASLKLLN
jgi:hypothetical protein